MRLLLVDGTNVTMRCAATQGDRSREQVIETAANMVRKAVKAIAATHLIVVFDPQGPTLRHAEYPEYKANRRERAGDTDRWSMEACAAFETTPIIRDGGVYCFMWQGVEADDVIATLAVRAAASTKSLVTVHVLSGDSDLLALARPGVHCWQFGNKKQNEAFVVERSAEWICAKYGITDVAQLADYKALVGEKGDNVPGVPKIGKETAGELLREYGSIAEIDRYGMLHGHGDQAARMRALVTLRTDVPLGAFNLKNCSLKPRRQPA